MGESIFNKWCREIGYAQAKRMNLDHLPFTIYEISSKGIKNIKVRVKYFRREHRLKNS
jgi:hypothetical protein